MFNNGVCDLSISLTATESAGHHGIAAPKTKSQTAVQLLTGILLHHAKERDSSAPSSQDECDGSNEHMYMLRSQLQIAKISLKYRYKTTWSPCKEAVRTVQH